jgi:anaerobic magnesium-protoporphyrin IX monomethyl ester cyclase
MDILLVFPFSRTHYSVPPLGLGYLATALRRQDFDVQILDCTKEKLDLDGFRQRVQQLKPRLVGFQTFSYDFHTVEKCLDVVKAIDGDIVTVVGGAHPSGAPRETLEQLRGADYAIRGEGEQGLPLLARRCLRDAGSVQVELAGIPGLVWRDQAGAIRMNEPAFTEDLDSLGQPSWDMMDPRLYQFAPQGVFLKSPPVAPISTSRGCPFQCTYCAGKSLTGARIRRRSISLVLDEVELLYREYGVREIHIVDDNFTMFRDRVVEFCRGLDERQLKIHFTFPNGVRIDTLDPELLQILKKAGCYSMIVGVESGSDRVLKAMKKSLTTETVQRGVALINQAGIDVSGFFILGFPGETREEMLKTIAFSQSLGLDAAHFSNFLPLPGTEATEVLREQGKLPDLDWSQLFYSKIAYVPDGITAEELKRLQRQAYLGFYLRPSVLWKLKGKVKSWHHVSSIALRLKDYLFNR